MTAESTHEVEISSSFWPDFAERGMELSAPGQVDEGAFFGLCRRYLADHGADPDLVSGATISYGEHPETTRLTGKHLPLLQAQALDSIEYQASRMWRLVKRNPYQAGRAEANAWDRGIQEGREQHLANGGTSSSGRSVLTTAA